MTSTQTTEQATPRGTLPSRYADKTREGLAEKIAKLQAESRITQRVCGGLPPIPFTRLYLTDLYGSSARVLYGSEAPKHARGHLGEPEPLTMDQVLALLAILPPVPLKVARNGCTSVCPRDFTSPHHREGEPVDALGIVLRFEVPHDGSTRTICTVEWYTDLPKPSPQVERGFTHDRVCIQCVLDEADAPAFIHATNTSPRTGEKPWHRGLNVTYCSLQPTEGRSSFWSIGAGVIKWAPGTNDHPNLFTVYFPADAFDTGSEAAILRRLGRGAGA